MQQQSNTYIIVFSAITTIVLGGMLAMANQLLKPRQQKSIELDTKRQILNAVTDLKGKKGKEILDFYNQTIDGIVIDINGKKIEDGDNGEPIKADKVNVAGNYKKPPEERVYPVFVYHKPGDADAVESYIIPVYGNGLWGNIWGFVALDTDLNTVKGASFDHESETPGLGARISSEEIESRFKGKKVFDESGQLKSVVMLKGERNPESMIDEHHVDGMSGATLTSVGLNNMLQNYFKYYSAFLKKASKKNVAAL